jgi:hypothetical protein
MKTIISPFLVMFCLLGGTMHAHAQDDELRIANYSIGKPGTSDFEELSFWADHRKVQRLGVTYAYGVNRKELELVYLKPAAGSAPLSFGVQFPNGKIFQIQVQEKTGSLLFTGDRAKYRKTFLWEYQGPIDGVGTACTVCVDEDEAIPFIVENFIER